jgi:hypothetical protein
MANKIIGLLVIFLCLPFLSAYYGFSSSSTPSTLVINETTTNVNNSDYLDGLDSLYFYPYSNPFSFYNSTTLPNLNSSGLIRDWNVSGYIKNWNATGLIANWTVDLSGYYLKTNPYSFWNDTYATFNKTYADTLYAPSGAGNTSWNQSLADTLYYSISNPYSYYNITTAPIYINDTFAGNYSSFLNKINWSQAVNGTLMLSANWNATNTSYYLVSNPYSYYNITTAPIYVNDTFGANYSTYLSLFNWNKTYADTLYYGLSNPYGYYNSSSLPESINYSNATSTFVPYTGATGSVDLGANALTSNYLTLNATSTGIMFRNETDEFLSLYSDNTDTLDLGKNYLVFDITDKLGGFLFMRNSDSKQLFKVNMDTEIANFSGDVFSNNYNLTDGYLYATNGTYLTSESLWNANYSDFLNKITWTEAVNGTLALNSSLSNYYLASNPNAYYNITTAPIYINDTFRQNYSTYLTLFNWNKTYADTLYSPVAEPLSLHLNQNNWNNDSAGYIYWDAANARIVFNQTKLETMYFNASAISAVRGTGAGVIGNLLTYDGISYNVTEASGATGLDFRVNFTGITSFNQIVFRYKSTAGENHLVNVQLYDFADGDWENYATLGEVSEYNIKQIGVFDESEHISGGVVQLRFYQSANGNTGHVHYYDWVTISEGLSTPAGTEIDPFSFHKNENLNNTGYNITGSYFFGNGSQLTGVLTSYTETDPQWTDNFTKYNASWSNTTNNTYHSYNTTGLIKDWNSTGYIANWNATGYIKDWNASGYIANWNASGLIKDDNATGYIKNWWVNIVNGTVLLASQWNATNTSYYLASNPNTYWNSTFATFNKTYADTLYYGLSNPYSYYNSSTAPIYLNDTFRGTNYSTFLTHITWANAVNGTLALASSVPTNNNQLLNGNTYWNSTFATFNKTYADSLYYGLSNPYSYYNSTNPQTELDPKWTDNFTKYNSTWSSITNTSYYLVSNPYAYYNSTTAPIYLNDTFRGTNYSTFLTHVTWANVVNGTMASWVNVMNGTIAKTSDLVNYNSSGLIKDWNVSGYIKDWNATGYIKNWWIDAYNGTLLHSADWNATNTSYVPFTGAGSNVDLNAKNLTNVNYISIGSNSANLALDVNGQARTNGAFIANGTTTLPTTIGNYTSMYYYETGHAGRLLAYDGTNYRDLAIGDWNSGNPNIMLKTGGNVGIATGSPQNKLNVLGDINATTSIFSQGKNLTLGYDYALNSSTSGSANWNANYSTYLTKPTWTIAYNGTLAKTDATNTFSSIQTFGANVTLTNNYLTNGTGGAYIRHNGTGWVIKG